MTIFQIAEDVYVVAGRTLEATTTVILSPAGALLIDGLASEDDASELERFISATLGTTVRQIVVTHYLADHMAALRRYPDVPLVAHRYYEHTWLSQAPEDRRPGWFRRPDRLVDAADSLVWGRHTLALWHNPGHTMSTLAIDIPLADAVVTADTTVGNIAYVSRGVPGMQLAAIERALAAGRRTVIPGHIGPFPRQALVNARNYLLRLGELVRAARGSCAASAVNDAILGIPIEGCVPEGTALSDFERHWHQQGLRRIVERELF